MGRTEREYHAAAEAEVRQATERAAFAALVVAARKWVDHMDQWEMFRFQTAYGPVYVTISMETEHPESFDWVGA